MKPLVILAAMGAAAFAQSPSFRQGPEYFKKLRIPPPKAAAIEKPVVVASDDRPCAIPLRNFLRGDTPSRMPKIDPGGGFSSREVQVPAPSCDDVKR